MAQTLTERYKLIDIDCHITEPADLWTSRMSKTKWGDRIPEVRWDPNIRVIPDWDGAPTMEGAERWFIGDKRLFGATTSATANYDKPLPLFPPRIEDATTAAYDPHARLETMDEQGVYAEVLYPNVAGFGSQNFLHCKDPALMYECVKVYNDFAIEWCSADPARLKPIMAAPFWDVALCVQEMQRCATLGHAGVLFGNNMHHYDQPLLTDAHWNPIWEVAQDLDLSINFHLTNGDPTRGRRNVNNGRQAAYVKNTVLGYVNSADQVGSVILSGMCHRYPKLKFVSIESGIGWIPFVLEALDWQFQNSAGRLEHPEMELPSFYFKRQCYASFWFETESAIHTVQQIGADNVMFETDFPHPTSLTVGPHSTGEHPKVRLEKVLTGRLPEADLKKILQDNAAKVYHVAL